MSHWINLWAGEKGGTGKSWGARLDCQRHIDQGRDFFLIDADQSNATASNYYGSYKYEKSAYFTEAAERASKANPILEAALSRPVVANCRAGTRENIVTWLSTKKVIPTATARGEDALPVCQRFGERFSKFVSANSRSPRKIYADYLCC